MNETTTARPLAEWHEDMGNVLWWKFPVDEPPWVGTPNDTGKPYRITIDTVGWNPVSYVFHGGGWPGYHTHWTPLPVAPKKPDADAWWCACGEPVASQFAPCSKCGPAWKGNAPF